MSDNFLPFSVPDIGPDEIKEINQVLQSPWLTTGPLTKRFEQQFAAYTGAAHAVALNSCTSALWLALAALDLQSGDEVITTPLTFISTVNVIIHNGAVPVLADICPRTLNISPQAVEAAVTPRTRAVIAVHYAGQSCEMAALSAICERHNLALIEDCAHGAGTFLETPATGRRHVGSFGNAGCFSFYATKNMTTGEGGMLITNNEKTASLVRKLSLHGISRDAWKRYSKEGSWHYDVEYCGYKCNMTDLQAALGIHQLARLETFTRIRTELVEVYQRELAGAPLRFQQSIAGLRHSHHLVPVILDEKAGISRNELIEKLKSQGIGTSVHFIPVHHHSYYKKYFKGKKLSLPVTDAIYNNILSLPLSTRMSTDEVTFVSRTLHRLIS
jgi:dTDP-4-amino-4,6-dideoxygalactose transaminase